MNEYTLLDKIIIDRPILFLCGPSYKNTDPDDRRGILKKEITSIHDKKFLPLIIDDFLIEKNINDEKINIQLMEEICAAVSLQTYIFLDTLSASAELGIFSNSAYNNKIKIFIPKGNDIYNKNNVGYFVKQVAAKTIEEGTRVYEYRPRVRRNAVATDYIVEFYSFVNNTIPNNITEIITDDPLLKVKDEHDLTLMCGKQKIESQYDICYWVEIDVLIIHTSIKVLFYTTLSIVFCEYMDFFKKKVTDFSQIDVELIEEKVKEAYFNLLKKHEYIDVGCIKSVKLTTILKQKSDSLLIYHILKFLQVFNNYSDYNKTILFKNPKDKIISYNSIKKYVSNIFPISKEQYEFAKNITLNQEQYFERIQIKKGRKIRDIIKYKNDKYGEEAKKLHKLISNCIERYYKASDQSFAYQKNKSIKKCVAKHINGMGFIKYDIKSFFNTITKEMAIKNIMSEFDIDERYMEQLAVVIGSCFWDNKLPLGFVSSPIISDICLKQFDYDISKKFSGYGLVYTRYADDILISYHKAINEQLKTEINEWVVSELLRYGFKINENKGQSFNFDSEHSFIRYLGINIVRIGNVNRLSVGRTYINDTAKEYISYNQMLKENKTEEELFYSRLRLIGKIGFIKQIEGQNGISRLKRRLFSYNAEVDLDNI